MEKKDNNEIISKKKIKNDLIIHLIILIILLFICIWDRIVNIPKFPKNFLFLTQICLYTNIIYYLINFYYNLKKQNAIEKNNKLLLFFNFNFTVSFVVFIMYWSMLFLDKATLYRNDSKLKVPTALNMLLHGGVFTTNLFEIFFMKKRKKFPYTKIIFYVFFTIIYVGALYIVKLLFNIKVYPFIYGNVLKFILIIASSFIICLIGHYLYILFTKQKIDNKKDNEYAEFELN